MISIDRVYKRVLEIINKESAGFVDPLQFNTIAHQSQLEIFEGFFSEVEAAKAPGRAVAASDYNDLAFNLDEQISLFEKQVDVSITTSNADFEVSNSDFYRLTNIYTSDFVEVTKEEWKRLPFLLRSPLSCPTVTDPVYLFTEQGTTGQRKFSVFPRAIFSGATLQSGVNNILVRYIRKPLIPNWVGSIGTGQPIPNTSDTDFQDFELHPSVEDALVAKILGYTGVVIREPNVTSFGGEKDQIIEQNI